MDCPREVKPEVLENVSSAENTCTDGEGFQLFEVNNQFLRLVGTSVQFVLFTSISLNN